MIPEKIVLGVLFIPLMPIVFLLVLFFGIFLFWRAGRRELHDSELIFDSVLISLAGSLILGRVFAFFTHWEQFNWSVKKLMFFNTYDGFDFLGALIGLLIANYFFIKKKKLKLFKIYDLFAAPIAFCLSIIFLFNFLFSNQLSNLYAFVLFFIVFFNLKRLERMKRHDGFFIHFYLISLSIFLITGHFVFDPKIVFKGISYYLFFGILFLFLSCISWYILANRKLKDDIKNLLGFVLLSIFKAKRVLTTVREADELAKNIILLPVYFGKLITVVAQIISKEIVFGFKDLLRSIGFKNDRYFRH